jgi:hypothetical protein
MKLLSTFRKDLILSFRSFYIYIEIVMAIIIVAVLLFVVPEEFSSENKIYLSMALPASARTSILAQVEDDDAVVILENAGEVKDALEKDRTATGLNLSMKDGKINYAFVLQGYEGEQLVNVLQQGFLADFASQMPDFVDQTKVTIMDPDAEKLNARIHLLPVFLVLNSAFLGLFIIASYVFLDKEQGTIKAFAVTTCRIEQYLLSKVGVLMLTGLITGLIMTLAVAGFRVRMLPFILLLLVSNAFGSVLGLFIASFFDSITKAMGWLYLVIISLSISSVSYFMPSFSPLFIRLLPSYLLLYAFRQVFLQQPDPRLLYGNIILFALLSILIFILASWRYKKTITI